MTNLIYHRFLRCMARVSYFGPIYYILIYLSYMYQKGQIGHTEMITAREVASACMGRVAIRHNVSIEWLESLLNNALIEYNTPDKLYHEVKRYVDVVSDNHQFVNDYSLDIDEVLINFFEELISSYNTEWEGEEF